VDAQPGPTITGDDLALVLTGGGARAAYQAGLLLGLTRRFPELRLPVLTGVSAGAINAVQLAAHDGSLIERAETLASLWRDLDVGKVFEAGAPSLLSRALRWALRLASGGHPAPPAPRGLVDTRPLTRYLAGALSTDDEGIPGIQRNIDCGELRAVAITASSYTTGRSITWVQSGKSCDIRGWERAHRAGEECRLTLAHVLASAALPVIFPAVQVGTHWYGDGGMRLTAPLSPAIHLGARRLLAVSTRYQRSIGEAERPSVNGYPPLAQIGGVLLNALFLDLLDGDALGVERINRLIDRLPEVERQGMRRIDLLVLRPSRDLGRMANDYEVRLPRAFRFLTRGLGTRETRSNDLLSLIMFQPDYVEALLQLGERDAAAKEKEVATFLAAA
jgi:NTE family protein